MRSWIGFIALATMLTALVLPPAHAKGTVAARAAVAAAAVPTAQLGLVQLGFRPYAEYEGETSPEPPAPPPARPQPTVKLPLCHEVTPVGVVIERASACAPPPR
jgi:hypothetical protein